MPRRRHDRHLPGPDLLVPGLVRARPLRPGADPEPDRDAAAVVVHADCLRRHDGGPDQAVPDVHGADADARVAAVLPVWGAVSADRAASLAYGADQGRPP